MGPRARVAVAVAAVLGSVGLWFAFSDPIRNMTARKSVAPGATGGDSVSSRRDVEREGDSAQQEGRPTRTSAGVSSGSRPQPTAPALVPILSDAEVGGLVDRLVEQVLTGSRRTRELEPHLIRQPDLAIGKLLRYAGHEDAKVRNRVLAYLAHAARVSGDAALRRQVGGLLVSAALSDPDPFVVAGARRDVYLLRPSDFSKQVKQELSERLQSPRPGFEIIRLAGFVGPAGATARFEQLSESPPPRGLDRGVRYYRTEQWAALLASARLGDAIALDQVGGRVQSESNEILRVAGLLDDLGYTQRREAFELLKLYLDSEEELPPPKDGGRRVGYAQHAASVLARWMPDFPLPEAAPELYRSDQISMARAWMADGDKWGRVDLVEQVNQNG